MALSSAGVEFDMDAARNLTGQPKPVEGAKTFGGAPAGGMPGMPGQPPGQDQPQPGEPGQSDEDDDSEDFDQLEIDHANGNGKAKPFGG